MTVKNVTPGAESAVAVIEPATPANPKRLVTIASTIRKEFGKGIDAQFAIGHLLREARAMFPADRDFGNWVREQSFPFTNQTAWNLRMAAEREPEVREYIDGLKAVGDRNIGVTTAFTELNRDKQPADRVKAVQELLGPEKDTTAFVKFRNAAAALDVTQLPDDELIELAGIVKTIAAEYNAEREARAERD